MDVLGLSGIRSESASSRSSRRNPDWFEWDSKSKSYFVTPGAYKKAQADLKAGTSDLTLAAYLAEADIHADLAPGAGPVTVAPWASPRSTPIPSPASAWHRAGHAPEPGLPVHAHTRATLSRTVEPHSLVQAGWRWHMRGLLPGDR